MKKFSILIVFAVIFTLPVLSYAQLKSDTYQPNISNVLKSPGQDFLFGLLDPSKMHMHHSFSMSYGTMGGNGLMLGSYMNTMLYQITDNLKLRTNLGIMTSPYHTFGAQSPLNKPQFFGGAQLDYKINDNMNVMLRIDSAPYYYYQPTLGAFGNGYFE